MARSPFIIIASAILFIACTPAKPIIQLPDLVRNKQLRQNEILENRQIKKAYLEKSAIVARISKEDRKEQMVVQAKKEKIQEEKELFTSNLLKMIQSDEIKELLKDNDVANMVNSAASAEELAALLKEKSNLSDSEIKKLVEYYMLRTDIIAAKDKETLEKILREKTNLSEEKIQELASSKAKLEKREKDLKIEALAKIYKRLLRNRKLGVEKVFCSKTAAIDQFVLTPILFDYDGYTVQQKASKNLFYEVDMIYEETTRYASLVLQIEGNCDERGSNAYNKALGDRRWTGITPLVTSQHFSKNDIRGISRGEECPTERRSDDMESWWQENRRSDLVWVLK